jgi:hypothetical protein
VFGVLSLANRISAPAGVTFSLAKANRFTRAIRLVMLLACTAFLFGNFAHASHVHTKSGQNDITCQLCQHFERSAPPPSPAALIAPSVFFTAAPRDADTLGRIVERAYSYFARGPPQR